MKIQFITFAALALLATPAMAVDPDSNMATAIGACRESPGALIIGGDSDKMMSIKECARQAVHGYKAPPQPHEVTISPKCEIVIVKEVKHADPADPDGYDPKDPNFRCGFCSSVIWYTNGKIQSGEYSMVPGMEKSRPGDRVRLCLVSHMAPCPKGDDRGKTYIATNLRTGMTWKRHDAMHMCGGA